MYHTFSTYLIGVQQRRENTPSTQKRMTSTSGVFLFPLPVTAAAPMHCLRAAAVVICNSIN